MFLYIWSGNHKRKRESGLPPATEMHAACTLHYSSIFMHSVSVPQYRTTANAPYHSQLAANFKCSNQPTFLLEGLSLQLDARIENIWYATNLDICNSIFSMFFSQTKAQRDQKIIIWIEYFPYISFCIELFKVK
jgi:hypothetical protein